MNLEDKLLNENIVRKDQFREREEFAGPVIIQTFTERTEKVSKDDSINILTRLDISKEIVMRLTLDSPPAMRLFDICNYIDC